MALPFSLVVLLCVFLICMSLDYEKQFPSEPVDWGDLDDNDHDEKE